LGKKLGGVEKERRGPQPKKPLHIEKQRRLVGKPPLKDLTGGQAHLSIIEEKKGKKKTRKKRQITTRPKVRTSDG